MSPPVEIFPGSHRPSRQAGELESAWKKELSNATTSVTELLLQLGLSHHINTCDIKPDFKCLATSSYISKIEHGNINDPLLQQILPVAIEGHATSQQRGLIDPVGDISAQASPGLLHKYHGRALLISTGACAIHCRYCFRRHYPYQQSSYNIKSLRKVMQYLSSHTEIDEIILSGGDPLVLDNEKLSQLISTLETIDHIKTLRIHTRIPVVLPDRINNSLLHILRSSRLQIVMVIHANHANELQQAEATKLHLLNKAGATLLNQSVLLKGINDNAEALTALSKRLFECKTLPYYLHLLDPVKGGMHFQISKVTALDIHQKIQQQLPGYLVPRLVQEITGNMSKTAIFSI